MIVLMFNQGNFVTPDPPQLSEATRLNHFQLFLFSSSFMTFLKWQEEEKAGAKGLTPQYVKFWRGCFDTRATWPIYQMQMASAQFCFASMLGLTVAAAGSPMLGLLVAGIYAPDLALTVAAVGNLGSVPEPPVILNVHRVENKEVEIDFKRSPSEMRKRSEYLWVYNVLHCSDSDAFPVPVAPVCIDPRDDSAEQSVRDPNPPTSGTSFYVMSLTRRIPTADAIGQMLPDNFAPWWGSAMDADSRLQRFKRQEFGVTSDYSNLFVYRADPFPELGVIDALAVDIVTGDVYISTPGLDGWIDVQRNKNNKLQPREHWVQAGFKMPGQHGLAIDEYGNLYSDNKASNDAFGGRIFQFSQPDGAREFVGSINYFSQLLMFANPVASGPMCFGWKTLFVWEDMSRDAREVDVLATYDPYRRVGQPYVNLTDTPGGPAIDMEYDGGLYILQLNQISEIIRSIDPNFGNYYSVVFAITIEEKK